METQTILRAIRNVAIAAGFFSLFIAIMVAMYFMTAWFYRRHRPHSTTVSGSADQYYART